MVCSTCLHSGSLFTITIIHAFVCCGRSFVVRSHNFHFPMSIRIYAQVQYPNAPSQILHAASSIHNISYPSPVTPHLGHSTLRFLIHTANRCPRRSSAAQEYEAHIHSRAALERCAAVETALERRAGRVGTRTRHRECVCEHL